MTDVRCHSAHLLFDLFLNRLQRLHHFLRRHAARDNEAEVFWPVEISVVVAHLPNNTANTIHNATITAFSVCSTTAATSIHTHTHARTHARTHTHTHTQPSI
jgi:hypothetical protein